ncbi:universal stress protein [Aquamicrobium segne]|uniref:Universal stress protein n=1 Tax=Aquamicrobium segne TaxID=469547 RepID=A0ABW0GW18_9HYPH
MYKHILVPSDGSAAAMAGVDHALELAKKHASKVTAITVTQPMGGQFAFASDLWSPDEAEIKAFDEEQAQNARQILDPIRSKAQALGIPIETIHIPWRLAAAALCEAATEQECSLIVMSSHGRTGMNRVLLGSQTAEVVSRAKIPVLVVR